MSNFFGVSKLSFAFFHVKFPFEVRFMASSTLFLHKNDIFTQQYYKLTLSKQNITLCQVNNLTWKTRNIEEPDT